MSQDRFAGLLGQQGRENGYQTGQESLRGFTTNPFAASITPAQALMYQTAYLRAQEELREPEWPWAENWN
jgi:hypothetical protein